MEARPAISFQRSDAKPMARIGISGALSSSTPVLPSPMEETYAKMAGSSQVSVGSGNMMNSMTHPTQFPPNSRVIGDAYSSSGVSNNLHILSVSDHRNHSERVPFISQASTNGASYPLVNSSHAGLLQSNFSSTYGKENSSTWCTDSLESIVSFPLDTTVQNSQIESSSGSGVVAYENLSKRNDWQEWADQLITNDDALTAEWNELLTDTNVANLEPRV